MSEWKDYKLGDIVNFQNGFAFKSFDFRYDGKYKIIRIKELKDGSVKFFEDTVSVSDEPNKAMSKYIVNKGDVIFALTGDPVSKSNPNSWVGRVSLYTHNESAYLNQRTCKITQRGDVIPQYVFYYFRHYDNFYSLASKATGSASQANISTKTLEDTIIILPSLEIQTKIVNILSSLDEKIETNRKINARLEELAQVLFKSWFIDNAIYDGSTVADYFLPIRGKALLTSDAVLGDIPVVAGGLSPATYHNQANTKAPVITISASGANAGYVNIWGCSVWSSDSSFIDNSVTPYVYFWYNLLKYYQKVIYHSQTGCAQPHIYPKHIGNIGIPKLSISKIAGFDNVVKPLYARLFDNEKESARLAALRDALLPKLMSGELKPE